MAVTRVWFLVVPVLLAPVCLAAGAAQAACTAISATALAFGTYTGIGIAQSSADVTLGGCTTNYVYSVGLSAGLGAGGTVTTRRMTNGGMTLNYQMFQNAAHTTNWGNTGNVDAEGGTTSGATTRLTIYAQLLGGQYPAPGTYTDTVTAAAINSGISTSYLVNATVSPACTISATNLIFPAYNPAVKIDSTSTLSVTCTNTTAYTVGVGYGLVNQPPQRYVANPTGVHIQYLLFQDAAHTKEWGLAAYGTALAGTGTGAAQALTLYGEISAGQFAAPGTYSDTVVVIVTY